MAEIHQENNTNTGAGAGAVAPVIQLIHCNGDFVNSGNIINGGPGTPEDVEMLRMENERLRIEIDRLLGIIENLTGNNVAL